MSEKDLTIRDLIMAGFDIDKAIGWLNTRRRVRGDKDY